MRYLTVIIINKLDDDIFILMIMVIWIKKFKLFCPLFKTNICIQVILNRFNHLTVRVNRLKSWRYFNVVHLLFKIVVANLVNRFHAKKLNLTLTFTFMHMCMITLSANIFLDKGQKFLHFFLQKNYKTVYWKIYIISANFFSCEL